MYNVVVVLFEVITIILYTHLINACKISNDSESVALAVTGDSSIGKSVNGLLEKVSFQTAFEGVESG